MNRIKECRINSKMSQKFVAVSLGVAAPSVSNWESGKTQPTPENFKRLADLFGVTVDYLIGQTDELQEIKNAQQSEIPGLPDEDLIRLITNLTQHEEQRVRDFVKGLKAAREAQSSQQP